jgi:hypothetical protein
MQTFRWSHAVTGTEILENTRSKLERHTEG